MGLYLCVFDGEDEVDGVELGRYADFEALRSYVTGELEAGSQGAAFPLLILHSDCDGEWTVDELAPLQKELETIIGAMKSKSPVPFVSEWQAGVARANGLAPRNAYESFVDVDGEFVLGRMCQLVSLALERRLPILFQ